MANKKECILRVRLRPGRDDDLIAWYMAQEDKSEAVRTILRANLATPSPANHPGELLNRLSDVVITAVHEALATYPGSQISTQPPEATEDPTLASRLDAQLDAFFDS